MVGRYWQEKGFPKEQIDIQVGEHLIVLYNFGEPLEEKHYEEIKRALRYFSTIDEGKPLKKIKYILIDNTRGEINPHSGEEFRGYNHYDQSMIQIYPKGRILGS